MIGALFTAFRATRLGAVLPGWAWALILIALLIGGGMLVHHVQVVRHDNAVRTAAVAPYKAEIAQLQATLKAISANKDRQQVITRDRIITVTKTIKVADDKARQIETAPLPGGCKSPKEVLNADL